jgi:hypothetical protein
MCLSFSLKGFCLFLPRGGLGMEFGALRFYMQETVPRAVMAAVSMLMMI